MSEERPLLRENEGGHFLRTYPASSASASVSVTVTGVSNQPTSNQDADHAQAGKKQARLSWKLINNAITNHFTSALIILVITVVAHDNNEEEEHSVNPPLHYYHALLVFMILY